MVLPCISMNQPEVYMCPVHPEPPLSPPSLPHPSRLSQGTSFGCPASCIELARVICFTCGNVRVLSATLSHSVLTSGCVGAQGGCPFSPVVRSAYISHGHLIPCWEVFYSLLTFLVILRVKFLEGRHQDKWQMTV